MNIPSFPQGALRKVQRGTFKHFLKDPIVELHLNYSDFKKIHKEKVKDRFNDYHNIAWTPTVEGVDRVESADFYSRESDQSYKNDKTDARRLVVIPFRMSASDWWSYEFTKEISDVISNKPKLNIDGDTKIQLTGFKSSDKMLSFSKIVYDPKSNTGNNVITTSLTNNTLALRNALTDFNIPISKDNVTMKDLPSSAYYVSDLLGYFGLIENVDKYWKITTSSDTYINYKLRSDITIPDDAILISIPYTKTMIDSYTVSYEVAEFY